MKKCAPETVRTFNIWMSETHFTTSFCIGEVPWLPTTR